MRGRQGYRNPQPRRPAHHPALIRKSSPCCPSPKLTLCGLCSQHPIIPIVFILLLIDIEKRSPPPGPTVSLLFIKKSTKKSPLAQSGSVWSLTLLPETTFLHINRASINCHQGSSCNTLSALKHIPSRDLEYLETF